MRAIEIHQQLHAAFQVMSSPKDKIASEIDSWIWAFWRMSPAVIK